MEGPKSRTSHGSVSEENALKGRVSLREGRREGENRSHNQHLRYRDNPPRMLFSRGLLPHPVPVGGS